MRVKIQHSCNMEDIPSLVVDKLQKIKSDLRTASELQLNYFSIDVLQDQISEIRYLLSDIDNDCDETQGIVAGFAAAHAPPEEIEEENIDEQKEI